MVRRSHCRTRWRQKKTRWRGCGAVADKRLATAAAACAAVLLSAAGGDAAWRSMAPTGPALVRLDAAPDRTAPLSAAQGGAPKRVRHHRRRVLVRPCEAAGDGAHSASCALFEKEALQVEATRVAKNSLTPARRPCTRRITGKELVIQHKADARSHPSARPVCRTCLLCVKLYSLAAEALRFYVCGRGLSLQ